MYAQITSLESLLRETDEVAARRRELSAHLAVLAKGIAILNEIRDTGIMSAPVALPTAAPAPPSAAASPAGSSPAHSAPPSGASPGSENVRPPARGFGDMPSKDAAARDARRPPQQVAPSVLPRLASAPA